MLNKFIKFISVKDNNEKPIQSKKVQPLLLPRYNQQINYNPEVFNDNVSMKKIDAYNKKGDKQFEQIKKADTYINDGKVEQGLKIYNKILIEDGLCLNSQSIVMEYLNHLYRLERYDEAWGVINQYVMKYPSLEKKYQEFRVKILKKEKKYKDALYHQILSILFDNIHYQIILQDKYENKYIMILKKLKKVELSLQIQNLIDKYTNNKRYDQRAIRDELFLIISNDEK